MWSASMSGAGEGTRFYSDLLNAQSLKNNNNNNSSTYTNPSGYSNNTTRGGIGVEHGTSPSTPAPAWFNWHRYKPQDRFPTPTSSSINNNSNYYYQNDSTNPLLPNPLSPAATNNNNNNSYINRNVLLGSQQQYNPATSPRLGAPRETGSRTPIIERGGALDPSSSASLHRQMTPSRIRKISTLPLATVLPPSSSAINNNNHQRRDNNNNNHQEIIATPQPKNMDQEEWSRRFGPQATASTLVSNPRGAMPNDKTTPRLSQSTTEMYNRYRTNNFPTAPQEEQEEYIPQIDARGNLISKRHVPGHHQFIRDENQKYMAATKLPGDRNKNRNSNNNTKNDSSSSLHVLLPWVPSASNSALAFRQNQQLNFDDKFELEQQRLKQQQFKDRPLERGEKLFVVNVVTDPVRLGTVSSSFNQTWKEVEHSPNHPKESGPKGLAASSTTPRSTSAVSTLALEKTSYVVLRNVRAKTVRGLAEAIELTLAEEHDIFLKFDDGFRFSNLMQSSPWINVKSLVGDELLRENRLNNNNNNTNPSNPAITSFMKSKSVTFEGDGDDEINNNPNNNNSDRVLAAVSKAAAAAAGSISFLELPTELTICAFPCKRRITFQVTCTTLNPAGVCIFPLKEHEVVLERRGSAWVSDMEQLRQAISRVTHRDCSKAPMFVLSSSSSSNNKNKNETTSSSSSIATIKDYEVGIVGLPKCEPLVGPHQLPPFCCILVTLPKSNVDNTTNSNNNDSHAFLLPDELMSASTSLTLPKRIKTPLAAAVIGDDDKMLMAFDNFVSTAKSNGGSVPLKREEILFGTDLMTGDDDGDDILGGDPTRAVRGGGGNNRRINGFVDDENKNHVFAMRNAADEMMDEFRKKFNNQFNNTEQSNSNQGGGVGGNPEIRKELGQHPARVNVNLIEHVISEGMARFGDYISKGQIKVPQVFPNKESDFDLLGPSASGDRRSSSPTSSARKRGGGEDDPERTAYQKADQDPLDEASRALLFSDNPYDGRNPVATRQYEVPKTRFRRALLQASMHLLRATRDSDVLSTDALVRSTSDIVDIVLRELEQTFGLGNTRPYMLPLGKHEVETIKKVAGRAVQLEIAVQVGLGSANGRGITSAPFFKNDGSSIARVNQERKMMGMRPLPENHSTFGNGKSLNNNNSAGSPTTTNGKSSFFEMPANSPGGRALTAAARAGDEKKEKEIASQLGLPSYEPLPDRKPLDGAVLVLTRPQFDLLTKRIVLFATCSVDIFSVQSAINAMRFHRRSAEPLQKTSEAAYFRWCISYGQHTAAAFHEYLRNKDAGSLDGYTPALGKRPIREVPLDALVELGFARIDIVSFARPTTLALEISLSRGPTDINNNNNQNDDDGNKKSKDMTDDILQADERYSVYLEVGDDQGGFIHQALTFILPSSVLHPDEYAAEQFRKSELRRGGKILPEFEEVTKN